MGLDTFAVKAGSSKPADKFFKKLPGKLIGGMFSSNGNGASFRGKCYDELVLEVTGQSLYEERIDSATVADMAAKLQAKSYAELDAKTKEDMTEEEYVGLQEWFGVCSENGLELVGWW